MHKVHLNGADAEKIAELMGGVLIMVDTTNDTATISGGDPAKLQTGEPLRKREDLEREALRVVSATFYYDLADCIDGCSDDDLRAIIAANGDEAKEQALATAAQA